MSVRYADDVLHPEPGRSAPAPGPTPPPAAAPAGGLPFDPRALAVGVWRRRALPVVLTLLAVPAGLLAGLLAGQKTYRADTVLLFTPAGEGDGASTSLQTHVSLVKVRRHLEETSRRLKLGVSPEALSSAVVVGAPKNTDLMVLTARSSSAAASAAIANTLRDVFLESMRATRREEAKDRIRELEQRLVDVSARLSQADAAFSAFVQAKSIVDLDKETGSYLQEAMSLEVLYQRALGEQASIDQQNAELEKAIGDLKKKVVQEQKAAGGDLNSLNIRIGRLRSAIEEDKRTRAAMAEMAEAQIEMEKLKRLWEQGLVAELAYQKSVAAFENRKALATDTDQIREWKAELGRLDQGVIPSGGKETASSVILREVMLKSLDLQLEKTAASERARRLDEARQESRRRLDKIPGLQKDIASLQRDVAARDGEKRAIEESLGRLRTSLDSGATGFAVVSEAQRPAQPESSNRRALLVLTVLAGLGLGLGLAVAGELKDPTVRSAAEARQRLKAPLLGVVPLLPQGAALLPDRGDSPLAEPFRRVALRLRRRAPGRGVRLLVLGPRPGEGATFVAAWLAAALGRQDERVLLIDAQLREGEGTGLRQLAVATDPLDGGRVLPASVETAIDRRARQALAWGGERVAAAAERLPRRLRRRDEPGRAEEKVKAGLATLRSGSARVTGNAGTFAGWVKEQVDSRLPSASGRLRLADLVLGGEGSGPGLGGYLTYEAASLGEVSRPAHAAGVICVTTDAPPRGGDALGSLRMRELLEEASQRYSLVLVDAPPVLPWADAEALAPFVDGAVAVVRAGSTPASLARAGLAALERAGVPLVGVVLNGVDRAYLTADAEVSA